MVNQDDNKVACQRRLCVGICKFDAMANDLQLFAIPRYVIAVE